MSEPNVPSTDILLATCGWLPDGEPGHEALDAALAERGISACWARWDDPEVDWADARLVAVRSTWDYVLHAPAFLEWARGVEQATPLLNGADCFAWNMDKAYLAELGDAVEVVPTRLVGGDDSGEGGPGAALTGPLEEFGTVVVKARLGAGGHGVVIADRVDDPRLADLWEGPWIAQPLVESVRTEGELSVFVLGGESISQARKLPACAEIRVHETHGGATEPTALTDEARDLAIRAMAAAADRLGTPGLPYGRVDMLRYDGRLHVSELELIEPGLYLEQLPDNGRRFAEIVAGLLSPRG